MEEAGRVEAGRWVCCIAQPSKQGPDEAKQTQRATGGSRAQYDGYMREDVSLYWCSPRGVVARGRLQMALNLPLDRRPQRSLDALALSEVKLGFPLTT